MIFIIVCLLVLMPFVNATEVELESAFYHNMSSTVAIKLLVNSNDIFQSSHQLAVIINNRSYGKQLVNAQKVSGQACFPILLFNDIKFKKSFIEKYFVERQQCLLLDPKIEATFIFDSSKQQVTISLPQASFDRKQTQTDDWDFGHNGINLQYDINARTASNDDNIDFYASINPRINFLKWRLELDSYYTNEETKLVSAVAKRDIPTLSSTVSVGNLYLPSSSIDSFSFNGVVFASEQNLSPLARDNYAPPISGIAKTNARIEISQSDRIILSEVIPPGPFEYNDYGFVSNGDLTLTIYEETGEIREFITPISTLPSLKAIGSSEYVVAGGSHQDHDDGEFLYGYYAKGLLSGTFSVTSLLGRDYQNIGAEFSGNFGAFGAAAIGMNGSLADDIGDADSRLLGWRTSFEYRKSLTKSTDFTFMNIGYRDESYRSFEQAISDSTLSVSPKNTYTLTIRQQFPYNIFASLSAYQKNYWKDGDSKGANLILSTSLEHSSISLSSNMSNSNGSDYWQVSLGFSIPIGPTSNPSYLYNSVVKTTEGETYSSSYSNSIDKYSTYGLSVSYDATNGDTTTSANINRKFNKISSYASVSHSENNTNWSASLSGSLLKIAESPIAMSSEHYNSALLVDIGNEQEVRFTHDHNSSDDRGLLIGSLSTYASNDKVISSSSLGIGIELQDNYYRIKPTQDALFYQVNEVTQRIPILMIFDNQDLPLGSEIRQGDNVVGTVGFDNSQLVNFIIGESERLTVFDNGNLICHVDNIGILDEKIKLKKVPVKYVQCK